jgi:hypothetical protein
VGRFAFRSGLIENLALSTDLIRAADGTGRPLLSFGGGTPKPPAFNTEAAKLAVRPLVREEDCFSGL